MFRIYTAIIFGVFEIKQAYAHAFIRIFIQYTVEVAHLTDFVVYAVNWKRINRKMDRPV